MEYNNTLYGLKRDPKVKILFDIGSYQIINVIGSERECPIEVSEIKAFSMPAHIMIGMVPYFPSKYEILSEGIVVYSSTHPPFANIQITDNNPFNYQTRILRKTISIDELKLYDIPKRIRKPSQVSIMRESAKTYASRIVQEGILEIREDNELDWHWCHLISFRMLPTEKAQLKRNLVCGTSACNGHMTNIESAVKRFIYEFKRPLGLIVTVSIYKETYLAKGISYKVHDKKGSDYTHSEYFEALADIKSDSLDHQAIYERMKRTFGES